MILRGVKKNYFSRSNILNINLDPPVVAENRQHTVLVAHVVTTIRRLTNAQRWGQRGDVQNITLVKVIF